MAHVVVVGGGPAGLSAALFAAKNGLETTVFDTGGTALHYAHLFNYLGVDSRDGEAFAADAREQVESFGADLREEEVTGLGEAGDGFAVETASGTTEADYLVLATGQDRGLADELDLARNDDNTVRIDENARTSVDGVYAGGWLARKDKVQVAISVGDGAAAALDVLSAEKGEAFHDFDTPDDAE